MTHRFKYNKSTDSGALETCEKGQTTTLDIGVLKVRVYNKFPEVVGKYSDFKIVNWNALFKELTHEQIKQLL